MSYINKPGRTTAHRKRVCRQQISDVISYGYIFTTKQYAKNTQRNLEKLITISKSNTLASKRRAASILLATKKYSKDELLRKLFGEISEKYKDRPGGYTRLLKASEERLLLQLV